ncbi:hypothetical protein ABBQ32_000492 [Trebouxia sp. C0010 RCD-2024]
MADIELRLLADLSELQTIADSLEYAATRSLQHNLLVGVIKSLLAAGLIEGEERRHASFALTAEGTSYLELGSPEAQVFSAVPVEGIPQPQLIQKLGNVGSVGMGQAMKLKWITLDKSSGQPVVKRKASEITDGVQQVLQSIAAGKAEDLPKQESDGLKKRKLIIPETRASYKLSKGPKFALQRKRAATDLTHEMLQNGSWRDQEFKSYNFNALGLPPTGGYLHPLLKVRSQFRKIFVAMGFEEMMTNAYVENSFWNFDALFQPQQHPARDAHDTFFLTKPAVTPADRLPQDYLQRVKAIHEQGGFGSIGYGYSWKVAEAEKNLLRTHTTAVSSRMLYKLAQEGFKPAKYFSIDRVFRNEAVDRTHLAEFHQIEGVVCDKGLTLRDLIGTLKMFFDRLGLKKLRFKPAYNPYTEPSMEIFSYSDELGKWMEVGNSGMFRPEMLRPMGLPEDVSVIAWGLSLERPTMILYGIDNIRDLFGHKVSLNLIRKNPLCRLGL